MLLLSFALVTIIVVFPWFTFAVVVLAVIFGVIYVVFRSAIRELKRLDNTTRYVIICFYFHFPKCKKNPLSKMYEMKKSTAYDDGFCRLANYFNRSKTLSSIPD